MKNFFIVSIVGFTLFISSSIVMAAGYGSAGCGLGSMVFGDAKGGIQIFAATTNGTSGNQTFGITSGTSNCDASGNIKMTKLQQHFVEQNYQSLIKEMAGGEGENLEAFYSLLGCSTDHYSSFVSMTKGDYNSIIDGETPDHMLTNIKSKIRSDQTLSSSCKNVRS